MLKFERRRFLWQSTLAALGVAVSGSTGNFNHSPKKILRFGLAADSHYADRPPLRTRYYRQSLEKMRYFIEMMNKQKVDFVMHLGDFKDEDENKRADDTLSYLKAIESEYARFEGPIYHCVGNHDVDSITKTQFIEGIENTGISTKKSYYSFDTEFFHCIVLDANYYEDGRDHFYKYPIDFQNTNIPQVEIEWLENVLSLHKNKPVLVFCHHPLFHFIRDDKQFHVNNYLQIQQLFQNHGKVAAVFQGHVHEERFQQVNGTHYITQLGMVDYQGVENSCFSIIELDMAGIEIHGYKRASSHNLVI
ncbi:MAG: metallophosphoesterase [Bacteroidetes bacterium]|nr:metallophosphoesterase [Bacteroidota bacterium]MCY4204890.1 metallophosphoesterase [Bacteroidota bacterium]